MTAATAMRESKRRRRLDFERSPLLVFYEVTRACDLVCQHCRACAQTCPHPAELRPAQSLELVDQLTEFPQPPMLILTGGDPLKRPDIFSLTEYATRSGLHVSITPSATPLVTRDAIRRLRDAGLSRMAISIDGSDATTHDAIRGVSGSFQRSLEILSDARSAGLSLQINTTLSPINVAQLEDMAELFANFGIDMWSVFFLVPVGRGETMARLSAVECEAAFERLWRLSQEHPFAIKTTEAPHYRRYELQQRKRFTEDTTNGPPRFVTSGVNDGRGVMFVSHTGTIHPSGFVPVVCGVFPLQHVVRVYQTSPIFRALRDSNRLEGKCGRCEFRKVCGGSRARALAVTGNLLASEPDCIYEPGVGN